MERNAGELANAITGETADLGRRLKTTLGDDYEVERVLGAGGFAVVFLVRDLQLKRHVAVKVLSPALITPTSVLRFRREAETVAQLSHPNIVPLHFIGAKEDLFYLVMSYVDGGSLADRLKREGPLPIDDAIRVLTEVASALAHAHKRGVMHRDVKPHNVLLDAESGRALVTDFGIARTVDSESVTATGIVLGTPAYLAPEQATGQPVDHRTDLFALGVVAYEVLTGRLPYEAPTPTAAVMRRLGGPPPPVTTLRPDVPAVLQQMIDGCLATEPADRFQHAEDIVRLLTGRTPTSGAQQTMATRKHTSPRRRVWLGIALASAVVVAAVSVPPIVMRSARQNAKGSGVPVAPALPPVDSGMVVIPAGEYEIGSNTGPTTALYRPAHRVSLAAFGIDRHEVTVGDYAAFVATGGASAPWERTPPTPATLPVSGPSFVDAMNYCRWKHRDGGRLPTEDEWEAAARGMARRAYPWGDAPRVGAANTLSAGRAAVAPVGTFAGGATPEGVSDLIGNVWEWTDSPMRAYPGHAPLPESYAQHRVIRGGAFNVPDSIATPWYRGYVPPAASPSDLRYTGFRCAMSPRADSSLPRSD